jgi:hypothetical protein
MIYLGAELFIKLSILLFVRRLCPPSMTFMRKLILGTELIIVASFIGSVFTSTFNCKPIAASWNINLRIYANADCSPVWVSLTAWAIIFALTDIWLVLMPMHLAWKLQIPSSTRIGILVIFACGFIATIAAIVKAATLRSAYYTFDASWHFNSILISSELEITFGLIAASLPALNVWLIQVVPKNFLSQLFRSSKSHSETSKQHLPEQSWQMSKMAVVQPVSSTIPDSKLIKTVSSYQVTQASEEHIDVEKFAKDYTPDDDLSDVLILQRQDSTGHENGNHRNSGG